MTRDEIAEILYRTLRTNIHGMDGFRKAADAILAAQQDGAREAANVFRRAVVEAGLADRRGEGAEAFRLRAVALAIEEAYPDAVALAYREAGVHAVEQGVKT